MMTRSGLPLVALLVLAWAALGVSCGESGPATQPCKTDNECTLPQLCGADGLCAAPAAADEGKACKHDSHCKSGACLDLAPDDAKVTPVCVQRCDETSACSTAGNTCAPTVVRGVASGSADTLAAVCVASAGGGALHLGERCSVDGDCSDGICEGGRCTRLCANACPEPYECTKATLSRKSLALEHDICTLAPALSVAELGSVTTPAAGVTSPLTFDIPAGVSSFVLVAIDDDLKQVGIAKLEAPDGTVLVDLSAPDTTPTRSAPYIGMSSVLIPGGDDPKAKMQSGTYKVWLQTYEPDLSKLNPVDGELERVFVVSRRWGKRGGLVDLNLHFSPGTGLTAATAPGDSYVKTALATLDAFYRRDLGVALGTVKYFDLTAAEDTASKLDQVHAICKAFSKPGDHQNAINVYIIKSLTFAGGISGGIPGGPGLYGHIASGIVVRQEGNASVMGRLMAHEIGHHLGLFHTSSPGAAAGSVDALSDTPSCAAGTQVESCPDYRNMMFPQFPASGGISFSAAQADVARGSPWLYETRYPEACGAGTYAVDVAAVRFGSGSTANGSNVLEGSCGGASKNERVHIFRTTTRFDKLTVSVTANGFAPVVYVRRDKCTDTAAEIACQMGEADKALDVELTSVEPGALYIVVDGGDGDYTLSISE
ncbi:MAG: hypothetical protein KC503_06745 [Myxococcales bacterium]|nr:hypothetical protein [Myxococcales bacterium]